LQVTHHLICTTNLENLTFKCQGLRDNSQTFRPYMPRAYMVLFGHYNLGWHAKATWKAHENLIYDKWVKHVLATWTRSTYH